MRLETVLLFSHSVQTQSCSFFNSLVLALESVSLCCFGEKICHSFNKMAKLSCTNCRQSRNRNSLRHTRYRTLLFLVSISCFFEESFKKGTAVVLKLLIKADYIYSTLQGERYRRRITPETRKSTAWYR